MILGLIINQPPKTWNKSKLLYLTGTFQGKPSCDTFKVLVDGSWGWDRFILVDKVSR